MRRLLICLLFLGSPLPAAAQTLQEQIIAQLTEQGFDALTVNRTLLGRVRIVAQRGDLERELVFNPQTGEILRDLWVTLAPGGARQVMPQIVDLDTDDDQDDRSGDDEADDNDDNDDDDGDDDESENDNDDDDDDA